MGPVEGALDEKTEEAPLAEATKMSVNQLHLKQAWDTSKVSTAEDWREWLRRLAVESMRESPSHALRENPNYGYANSPSYGRGPQARPPPVPAKVPLGGGQEDWGAYDLNDDFSSIDIGPGPGRPRRTQIRYAA